MTTYMLLCYHYLVLRTITVFCCVFLQDQVMATDVFAVTLSSLCFFSPKFIYGNVQQYILLCYDILVFPTRTVFFCCFCFLQYPLMTTDAYIQCCVVITASSLQAAAVVVFVVVVFSPRSTNDNVHAGWLPCPPYDDNTFLLLSFSRRSIEDNI